jgi:methionine-rich copper-binding protein CopC/putative copper export protein
MFMRQGHFLRTLLISMPSLCLLLTLAWLPFLFRPPVALAHAFVIGSDPVDGSTINTPPAVVRIFFNELISPASIAHVYFGINDQLVDGGRSNIASNNPQELDTPLLASDRLSQGSYTVRWTALASADGHATRGVIGFNVGHSSTGIPGQVILGPSTSNILPQLNLQGLLAVAWEWLGMAALALWIGILVMEGIILEGGKGEHERGRGDRIGGTRVTEWQDHNPAFFARLRKRALPLQWLCLTALFTGEIINLVLRATLLTQAFNNNGIDPAAMGQLIIDTTYGHLWLIRIVLIGAALGFLWWTTRSTRAQSTRVSNRGRISTRTQAGRPGGRNPSSHYSRLRQQVAQVQGITSKEQEQQVAGPSPHPEDRESDPGTRFPGAETSGIEDRIVGDRAGEFGRAGASPALPPPTFPAEQPEWHTIVWLTLAGLILLTLALAEDVTQLAQAHISAAVLDWLFLAAQGTWFGGVAYLGFVLLPLLPVIAPDHHAGSLVTLLNRYTPLVLGTIAVLLVSGFFLVETSLSNVQQLITDPFGRVLLIKIVLIVLILLLSGFALFFLRPQLHRQVILLPVVDAEMPARRTRQSALEQSERRLKQTMRSLSYLGAGVLLCAALMSFFAPPIVFPNINYAANASGSSTATTPTTTNTQVKQAGNLTVKLQVYPARVDFNNSVIVTLNDSSGNPVTDAQVQISINMELMDMGIAHATIQGGNATYVATLSKDEAFSMPGFWDIVLKIQRPNQAPAQVTFQVTVALTG